MAKQVWTFKHAMAAKMMAMGRDLPDIYLAIFGTDRTDPVQVKQAEEKLRKMRRHPEWDDYYRKFINDRIASIYGKAIGVCERQLDDSNGWLANKAANDIIGLGKTAVMGNADNELTVKIEGMPEIGAPDPTPDA